MQPAKSELRERAVAERRRSSRRLDLAYGHCVAPLQIVCAKGNNPLSRLKAGQDLDVNAVCHTSPDVDWCNDVFSASARFLCQPDVIRGAAGQRPRAGFSP